MGDQEANESFCNPEFATVMQVVQALGLKLSAVPAHGKIA
jgi:DNA-binding phage protein